MFCTKCDRYMDRRHVETCTGKVFKLPRVWCEHCQRMTGKRSLARHMKKVHKIDDWRAVENPEPLPEVNIIIHNRLILE